MSQQPSMADLAVVALVSIRDLNNLANSDPQDMTDVWRMKNLAERILRDSFSQVFDIAHAAKCMQSRIEREREESAKDGA